VYDERLRIARDLHDMVSHGMSVITIQAEFGALRAEQDPAAARQALLVVEETGRETLWQLRQLVDVLRTSASADGDADASAEGPSLSPAPGLEDLPDLLTRTAAAGLRVDYEVRGEVSRVPAGVGLCVFRVVQEGVANVLQHSGANQARLLVQVTDDDVGVRLTNGPGSIRRRPASAGKGHGLLGIRERVHLLGGRARVGPTADGGYDLEVLLPVLHRSAETTSPLP
jgi:signal transduction histidine kinase